MLFFDQVRDAVHLKSIGFVVFIFALCNTGPTVFMDSDGFRWTNINHTTVTFQVRARKKRVRE